MKERVVIVLAHFKLIHGAAHRFAILATGRKATFAGDELLSQNLDIALCAELASVKIASKVVIIFDCSCFGDISAMMFARRSY